MKKIFLVLILVGIGTASLFAQERLKRKGDDYYEKLSYQLAIPYYEHHLKKHIDNDATIKLADCYRLTHNYEKAALWYDKVLLIPNHPPVTYFYYGHALMQKGDMENAKLMFTQYSNLVPSDKRGKNFLKAIGDYENLMRDSVRAEVRHLPFNTAAAEFSVFPYKEGIIFASSREVSPIVQDFNWLKSPFLNFFYTEYKKDSSDWSRPVQLKGDVNTKYHESNFTKADNVGEFFFTRNNFIDKKKGASEEGVIKLKLYKGIINGLETSSIEELGFNSDQYSVTHPSISPDGSLLYFSSDMPGGEGGKDIYVCRRQGNNWSKPENLKEINTSGDEMFPFVHRDGTLYFSSDGHPGLGHLDIFYVKLNGDRRVVNMGYPVNTAWDDFAFYLDDNQEDGFLASDREGGSGGDDIYKVLLRRPTLEIFVIDSVANLPLENARVTIRDMGDNSLIEYTTDSTGYYYFKSFFAKQFEIVVETDEFDPQRTTITLDPSGGQLLFTKEVKMWSPPPSITGIVIDDSTQERLPGSTVEFVNIRQKTSQIRTADRNGRFHIKLDPNTLYEMNVRQKGYLTFSQRVSTTLVTFDGDTIIPLVMEKIPFNKPIVLENIHYDFDKWTIRADAYNDLIYLATLMEKNPDIIVELGSHTDCRGSDSYNENLSQKRANSARYFLIDMGIDPRRIQAKGYGENKLANKCDDGVYCPEKEHDRNRRTEFKIVGLIDGIDMDNSILETDEAKQAPMPKQAPKPEPKPAPAPKPSADAQKSGNTDAASASLRPIEEALTEPGVKVAPEAMNTLEPAAGNAKSVFRVRLGGYMNELSAATLDRLGELRTKTYFERKEDGSLQYFIGDYAGSNEAKKALEAALSSGFFGAYISGYQNGKEMSVSEMKQAGF